MLSQHSSVFEQIWKESKGKPMNCKNKSNDYIDIQKAALYGILCKLRNDNAEEIKKLSKLLFLLAAIVCKV